MPRRARATSIRTSSAILPTCWRTPRDGADVLIDLGAGDTLTLQNVQKSTLTAGDSSGPGRRTTLTAITEAT